MSNETITFFTSEELNLNACIKDLQSEDKFAKKRALIHIKNVLEKKNEQLHVESTFKELHTYILRCFSDKAETCRELSIDITLLFINLLPLNDYFLTYILPVIVKRVGQSETIEECEELRLKHVLLVKDILRKYQNYSRLSAFLNDFTNILTKTCADSFAKVKIESCESIMLLSNSIKHDFHLQSESFIKPILRNFSHQQFRVRVAAINAIGAVVLNGSTKCIEESIASIAEKLFDDMHLVRLCVINNVGYWMLHYRDRYSFWHKMIPLLLTGLSDVHPDVINRCKVLWNDIGVQYIDENEDQLKDRLHFEREPPHHYPPMNRPNLGCRVLVETNISKIIPAIVNELEGWQGDARLRSAQLLSWLVLYAETSILQHAAAATRCFLLGAKNDDVRVNAEIYRASELLGYFVPPDIWWELLSPEVENWPCLAILSNIIKGSETEVLNNVYLKKIIIKLSKPSRCRTIKSKYQVFLLNTCKNLMIKCGVCCESVGQEMFDIMFTVLALAANQEIQQQALDLLRELSVILKCGSIPEVCERYVSRLLGNITSETHTWTMVTPDRCILEAVMVHSGKAIGKNLHLLTPLLVEASSNKIDAEVKLRLFTNLSSILLQKNECLIKTKKEHIVSFFQILVKEVIVPNIVWSAGRSSESIRTVTVFCLCAILQNNLEQEKDNTQKEQVEILPNIECLEFCVNDLLPLIIGLLDDNSCQTRLYTMTAICSITKLCKKKSYFNSEQLHKVYPGVLKRLDDSNDTVRLAAMQTLCILFISRPPLYDINTFQSHIDAVYSAMLIHLDDMSDDFVKETLHALKELSEIHPKLLKKKIEAKMNLFKNKDALEILNEHIQTLCII